MIPLQELGNRICIIGPSNSGKSTLAQTLATKLNVPFYHLDQLAHVPGTNWQRRANEDWRKEHDSVIENADWIIEGTYSFSMPQRFARATYVIWLDFKPLGCVYRYILRTAKNDLSRPGRLAGIVRESFNWQPVKYILFGYPKHRHLYQELLNNANVPVLRITTLTALNHYYLKWQLADISLLQADDQ